MKTRLLGALVGLAISFALPTFAQQKKPVNPRLIREANDFNKKYCEAVNNHDAAAIGALYYHNVVNGEKVSMLPRCLVNLLPNRLTL